MTDLVHRAFLIPYYANQRFRRITHDLQEVTLYRTSCMWGGREDGVSLEIFWTEKDDKEWYPWMRGLVSEAWDRDAWKDEGIRGLMSRLVPGVRHWNGVVSDT